MRRPCFRGLGAACLLTSIAIALPASAFVGNWRGPKVDGELALPGLTAPAPPCFDDTRTPQKETLSDLVRRVAASVKPELQAKHGADASTWKWGDEHRIHFFSPPWHSGSGRNFLGFAEAPMSGSDAALLRALSPFMEGFNVPFFASMRMVADMGDDDKIKAVVSGGVVDRQFRPRRRTSCPRGPKGGC